MIARIWHGVTPADKADAYTDYLNQTGVPESLETAGNQGVYVLRQIEGEQAHFLFISLWESKGAIEQFAGSDIEIAKYYPEDSDYLLELEPNVTHYEVMATTLCHPVSACCPAWPGLAGRARTSCSMQDRRCTLALVDITRLFRRWVVSDSSWRCWRQNDD
jgi:heme-degrading monooxygenase HmoA